VLYRIKLKNSPDSVLLDEEVYKHLSEDPYLKEIGFISNLRKHSSGCAVFQKTRKKEKGVYITETIYLHKYIGERFHSEGKSKLKNLVGAKNGNKLDCRLENIEWRSRSTSSRQRKSTSKTGYTGVYQEKKKFRAIITINNKTVHIGMFDSAEEAALAYNKRALEVYGSEAKLNVVTETSKK
jgi:hypothetical protein